MGDEMINVFIADDHYLVREGFKKIVEKEIDLQVAGEAENAAQVYDFLNTGKCDVMVLDISMPGKSGLDLLQDLKENYPDIKVLILSMHPQERFGLRCLKLGGSSYISKESAPEQLVTAIRNVYRGQKYITQEIVDKLVMDLGSKNNVPPHEKLSNREFQVFLLLASGKSVSQIGEALSLGRSTVNTYRTRILEKMNMKSNLELIHYAIRNQLVE